ncbi:LysR family transcriptional regulator [Streptomyces marincola]|uniref:LysR family transcriptional regulator n=1 Tax=Streptomyces marincola TaxID=2878388 RepID=UPI001CF5BCEA|nr:LysR family transcriptional regulator [Streptomyces marincola]UCM91611.1 LysR family transcriptional regulator [Streptomyces marincola]
MDLVGACRAFVNVSERGSFTIGAAAARMAQSVASRRIAALEQHLGRRLLERSSRAATLTPFGRDMLPLATQLVRLADQLEHEAEAMRHQPLRIAVPATCPTAALAHLIADAHSHGIVLDAHPADPAERAELVRLQRVRAALLARPPHDASWTVPLGLAVAEPPHRPSDPAGPEAGPLYLDTLRPGRTDREERPRRVWLQPEDDVPHIRDSLARLRDAVGLRPAQLSVARSVASAVADVLSHGDALLSSPAQAGHLGLRWRPIGELAALARGYTLAVADAADTDATRLGERCADGIARCLGATADAGVAA